MRACHRGGRCFEVQQTRPRCGANSCRQSKLWRRNTALTMVWSNHFLRPPSWTYEQAAPVVAAEWQSQWHLLTNFYIKKLVSRALLSLKLDVRCPPGVRHEKASRHNQHGEHQHDDESGMQRVFQAGWILRPASRPVHSAGLQLFRRDPLAIRSVGQAIGQHRTEYGCAKRAAQVARENI